MKHGETTLVRTDTDRLYYKKEDTYWVCPPDDNDMGILAPKDGAIPVDIDEPEDLYND